MDRTRATVIASIILTATAIAGNTIRAAAPRAAASLGLAELRLGDAERAYLDQPLEDGFLDVLRAREVLFRTYDPDAVEPVWVFLGYFDQQREGSQVHSPRHCYPGAGWNIEQEMETRAAWRDGTLHALVVSNGAERRLVCFWYQTPSGTLGDVFHLKLALTRQAVLRRPQDVVFASVSTPFTTNLDLALERTTTVAREVEREIARLYRARGRA